jgi:hypothetical protein
MGARESMIVGSTLLAISFLASTAAPAMEPMQPNAPASTAAGLPSFLDDESLPALQEAWRTREQVPDQPIPAPQPREALQNTPPATSAPPATAPDPMAAARAAIERVNGPGRDDVSVRRRAEELSRRFSLGAQPSAPDAAPAPPSVMIPPAVVPEASLERGRTIVKPNPPTRTNSVTVPVTTGAVPPPEVQPLDASVRTQSALATERSRLAAPLPPPPPAANIPPLPRRAPNIRAAVAVPSPTAPRTVTRSYMRPNAAGGDPKAVLRGTVLTNQLRAFGWNNQPQ